MSDSDVMRHRARIVFLKDALAEEARRLARQPGCSEDYKDVCRSIGAYNLVLAQDDEFVSSFIEREPRCRKVTSW